MKSDYFFLLVAICIITHITRLVYELLKHKNRIVPGKLSFVIVFANMMLLWLSWFALCGIDQVPLQIPGFISYFGIVLVILGVILFLTALFTIKSLETYKGDLISYGIYSKIRHPMYLGFIFWLVGMPLFYGGLISMLLGLLFIANVLYWRYLEEKELIERFPTYMEYRKKTYF